MVNRKEKNWKQWQIFFSLAQKSRQKVTVAMILKKCFLLGKNAMKKLDNVLQSRNITLLTRAHMVKAMIFPGAMYGCESWTTKKAECQEIYAYKLWCWRVLLTVPWTARKSDQSILKEINLEYSLEGLMIGRTEYSLKGLKLDLWFFAHLMGRANSLEKTLILGKTECKRRRRWQRFRWLDSIMDSMGMNLSKLLESEGQVSLVWWNPYGCIFK